MRDDNVELKLTGKAGQRPLLRFSYNGDLVASDFAAGAYATNASGEARHYLGRAPPTREAYYGLGESAGAINRRGGRFRLAACDAMGYEADPARGASDPLYKHFPMCVVCAVEC